MSNDEVEDELVHLYNLELKKETDVFEKKNIEENFCEKLYMTIANFNFISTWRSVEEYNIDQLLTKIDKKIAELERKEKATGEYQANPNYDNQIENNNFCENLFAWDIFKSHTPQEGFSDYYKLFFAIAFLYRIAYQLEVKEYDQNSVSIIIHEINNYRFNSYVGDRIVKQIVRFMLNNENDINSFYEIDNEIKSSTEDFLIRISKTIFKANKISQVEKRLLMLVIQLHTFVQMIFCKNIEKEQAMQNALAVLSLAFADSCRDENKFEYGYKFASLAFVSSEAEIRWDAYNVSGLCAIEGNKHQLAYDTYFAWINQVFIESLLNKYELKEELANELNEKIKNSSEEVWRKNNADKVAVIYCNFAYVCGIMYDNIEDSIQKRRLLLLAEIYIKKAIELNPKSNSYYCSAGTIYSDLGNNENSLYYYGKYNELSVRPHEKLQALSHQIVIYTDMILDLNDDIEFLKEFDRVTVEFLKQYKVCSQIEKIEIVKEELEKVRDIYYLISECEKVSAENKELKVYLFKIKAITNRILKKLRQVSYAKPKFNLNIKMFPKEINTMLENINSSTFRAKKREKNSFETKKIAYYTSLKNLKFLLDETSCGKDEEKKINCFTMMHAKYMNDPEEGLVLLRNLKNVLPESPESIRNEVYDQKYIFIKSFTELIDQLNMWTMYGSDKSLGEDCNGCCVCIAKETFDMMTGDALTLSSEDRLAQLKSRFEDDYHLYSIAYMDDNYIYVNNKRDSEMKANYDNLKNLLNELKTLQKSFLPQDIKIVTNCIVRLLGDVMFVFKDVSYYMENESRLIITRDINDFDDIKKTDQTPPKLFINPPYQVYPEKIILGPKVENADYWMPHLQYELSKIKTKWMDSNGKEYKPIVRGSNINIRSRE